MNVITQVALALTASANAESWARLAISLAEQPAEIHLRGMIVMPEAVSLSEGALPARDMRNALDQAAHTLEAAHDEPVVYVDFRPMAHVLNELTQAPADLLLVQWQGPTELTGGISTDEILQNAPCDVVLLSGESWDNPGPVLLSLRGGPNISLGVRVAKALSREAPITLFHAAANRRGIPPLDTLMRADLRITRTVTALTDFTGGILHEAATHKAIVLGAAAHQPGQTAINPVIQSVYERAGLPMALVRARRPEDLLFHAPRPLLAEEALSTRVDRWFAQNTFHSDEFSDLEALLALKAKQEVSIGLALPALNEAETVGSVIDTLKGALMDGTPLLDEIVLIDSDSEDDTVSIAQSCGIPVYKHPEILPEVGSYRGKGEALWKSLHVLKSDIIVWIDTDITNIHPRFIYGLLGPLLKRPTVQYVKGFYQRPIKVGDVLQAVGGGRVTELVARPLLNLFYPELSGIIQPLSGEYAGRRAALESTPFFTGYGVETGLLIDLHERYGLDGIAQVDLGERIHHNQSLISLSKMSFAIHQVFVSRIERRYGVQLLDKANRSMKLITHEPERFALDIAEIGDVERPPMITLPAYQAEHGC